MNITKLREGSAFIVALEGRLDTSTAPELETQLNAGLDGVVDLVIDMKDLVYLSSAGLRVILAAQKRMNKQGSMKVCHVNETIMEVFEVGNTTPQDRNFGKLMALQGIQANNLSTGAIVTATSSQILAISFIKDLAGTEISWMKWFIASAPVAIITLAASFLIGKMLFKTGNRSASAEKMTALEEEYKGLGKMNGVEVRALIIFLITIFLWATDEYHGAMFGFDISLVVVAIVSAAIFLMPHVGILTWKEAKIPWDLMIFSCGAYAGGLALDDTGVATWVLNSVFDKLGVEHMSFMVLYAVIIFIASFSHFVFTSKTVRTIILIPTIISIAQVAGFNPVALALPASFMICDTITLPPHSKVNLTYYSTGKFTVLEEMTYGVLTLLAKWGIMVAASFTWFKMIGIM